MGDQADQPLQKRLRPGSDSIPPGIVAVQHVEEWYENHKDSFTPPICNKLMHKDQLTIMWVGGPNTRKDFHLEEGSEFFYQLRGDIEVVTVQRGERVAVPIKQGQVFCLPSRVPHSPQRPQKGSFGLVVERERAKHEMDGLIFFTDFEASNPSVHWEQFFYCADLGKDLPPVIGKYKEFIASEEGQRLAPRAPEEEESRPVKQDRITEIPPPFYLDDFIRDSQCELASGKQLPLFGGSHPDQEFRIFICGGPSEQAGNSWAGDTWLYQIRGSVELTVDGTTIPLDEGCCCIVQPNVPFDIVRPADSIGMTVQSDPLGNKEPHISVRDVGEAPASERKQ